ncbi:uncharacterized protein E0L32_002281 [Thyridium curvatum]|uniref:Xylanolytic transcriptional activator regulatory domain-containing protein n=1 Tax=Thyridium curvatum TaxID=1093900 RepID=A0A507AD08_9PEZI|nr:uncharacterized protein E0L32_002281 [Thyridium curvatum]TPX06785.1 hypothetical protein E0L32_002281 [Thyridium curvatum]
MIFSISLLLGKTGEFQLSQARQEDFYQVAISRYLPHMFSLPDRVLHIQAYLLLAMHALYSPSTERLVSITSTAMRYCVMAQLHLADAEPRAADVAAKVGIQLRRRVFWSAYALDRAVSTMFHLPFCIPDYQITTKMYANVDDADLYRRCEAAFPDDPHSQPSYTNISAALHIVYCRQIQSEILNTTLHRDFEKDFDRLPSWRRHILEKLDRWKSLCHRYTEDGARLSLVHEEWLHIVYNYSLLMLYQPNRQTAGGPAGDWTVKACVQTILIFRKFQRESAISEAWMGLIAQFKSGVALLYCFWATQGLSRSAAFDPSEVSEAVRCCSIVLSLLAERWHSTKVLRDAFDILAREVPLVNFVASPSLRPKRIRPESSQKLLSLLSEIEAIVVHRDTLRMIREMATEAFPVSHHQQASTLQLTQDAINNDPSNQILESDESPMGTAITGDLFQPVTPHFFTLDTSNLEPDDFDYAALGFPGLFDPTI